MCRERQTGALPTVKSARFDRDGSRIARPTSVLTMTAKFDRSPGVSMLSEAFLSDDCRACAERAPELKLRSAAATDIVERRPWS